METEMDFSDGEQTNVYNNNNNSTLVALYGNPSVGLEKRRFDNHELPGYIFMCNCRTKHDCYRYRVFGVPRGRKDVVESIKPGMKLFLYDFEKRLLYGVYEATVGGMLDIQPDAFDRKYPAQVGFRIVKNCYPLPENAFKSAICENYTGGRFKQELAPHQVVALLSLFRSFNAPELDSLPHRLASRASAPRALSFEERFIAASQLRNGSSGLDHMSAGRHGEPRLGGSLMAHQSVTRTPLVQRSYSRQDDYATPVREVLSLSNLNQPYFPTENRQQRVLGEPSQSSIQDPQLKYLTILSNIRRYGTATEGLASENEYHPATPSEKDQFASPYSDSKYYPAMLSGNEHPSASTANGNVYRSEFRTSESEKEGEASQQREIPADTYYHPEASTVPNTTLSMQSSMQANSVAQPHANEIAGYSTVAQSAAPQPATGEAGNTHQLQSVTGNYATHSQPVSVEESTQSYGGTVSNPQHPYYAAMGNTTQLYASGTGYIQQPQSAANGYVQQPYAAATGYAQQPHPASSGYAQQPYAQSTGYTQQPLAASTGYAQQPQAASTGYAQQPQAESTGYSQQPHVVATAYTQQPLAVSIVYAQQLQAAATEYPQQPNASSTGYAQQLQAAATEYAQQPHAAVTGYAQQLQAAAAEYAQQPHAAVTGYAQQLQAAAIEYAQQPHASTTGYAQQSPAAATGYAQQLQAASTGYAQQPHAQANGYTMQPHAQAVGYMPQYHPQAGAYTQQAVMQGSIPGAPGTTGWNAASQAYSATGDWNAVNQAYYPHLGDTTTTYNQTS